jgi:hypothetical protein
MPLGRMRVAVIVAVVPIVLRAIGIHLLDAGRLVNPEGEIALRHPVIVHTRRARVRRWLGTLA